jgi:sugar phosphate isomerase/epimerase
MILFEWGTYNAKSTLEYASLIGTRITEVPPAILTKRLSQKYYEEYKNLATKNFSLIIGHGPYYNILSKGGLNAHLSAVKKAKMCGCVIYNFHPGLRTKDSLNDHLEVLKKLNSVCPEMVFSIEPATDAGEFGTIKELEELIKAANEENINLIPSLQLENVYINELKIYETGDFEELEVDKSWWLKVLNKFDKLSKDLVQLRFSQVVGLKYGDEFYKKRVPLGKGYPDLKPLVEALSEYMVKNAKKKHTKRIIFIYTGLPEYKYKDLIDLYSMITKDAIDKLIEKAYQKEHGEDYKNTTKSKSKH